jgi:hypothetical protein
MKKGNTLDDLEGMVVSFGNHKFVSSKKYFTLVLKQASRGSFFATLIHVFVTP